MLLLSSEVIYPSIVPVACSNFTCHVHNSKRLKRLDEMELINSLIRAVGGSFGDA